MISSPATGGAETDVFGGGLLHREESDKGTGGGGSRGRIGSLSYPWSD